MHQALMVNLGFPKHIASQWSSGTGDITLKQGKEVANYLGVQTWWLLGMDELKKRMIDNATYSETLNAWQLDFGRKPGHLRLKEIILASLNWKIPWRPDEHVFEPIGCESYLTSPPGSTGTDLEK